MKYLFQVCYVTNSIANCFFLLLFFIRVIEIMSSKQKCVLEAGTFSIQDNDENDVKQFGSGVSSVKQE